MHPDKKLCFVIGPMGDGKMARLRQLANDVVAPLVEPYGFVVETPDHADVGRIIDQVILSLDQADLLVADLTGNNPNVLYELAIYHTAGRPYVTVRDTSARHHAEKTPFDIQAYRYVDLDLDSVEGARKQLEPTIQRLLRAPDKRNWYSNPITDFYNGPVTHLRYATALAENYIRNFVRKVVEDIYEHDAEIRVDGRTIPSNVPVRLELILPSNLNHARHRYIKQRLLKTGTLQKATVEGSRRSFSLYAYPDPSSTCRLVDVPTILATIRDSVEQRMGPLGRQGGKIQEERALLESAEVQRFKKELLTELDALKEEQVCSDDQIRIVDGNPFEDAPSTPKPRTGAVG